MSKIKFGPSGLGSVGNAISKLVELHDMGLRACEIAFVHQVYIEKDDALKIGKKADELGIFLSIHAQYYVNLNSKDSDKIDASKNRILKCCEIGHYLGAKRVVFHPGFYSDMKSEDARKVIKKNISEMMVEIKNNGWNIKLCPEVMGKINVFGSIEEISWLVDETGCSCCIDVAHILARYGRYEFEKIKAKFRHNDWHLHFSGIEYGEKGEKKHLVTSPDEWRKVLGFLKGLNKNVIIICESPNPVGDSVTGMKIWKDLK